MIQPSVVKIAAIAGAVLAAVLIGGFAIATHSWGSALLFLGYVGIGAVVVFGSRR